MLTEVQKQLERAFPTRKLMFPVTTTLEIRQELKAATVRGHVRLFEAKIFFFRSFNEHIEHGRNV